MSVMEKVRNLIGGVYSVATPFHPFGGAVDVIVVQQQDGSFRSTPWYVRFGKFQGVLKGAEKIVRINVNGVEANFHMYLDNSGEAYFVKEVDDNEVATNSDSTDNRLDEIISDSGVLQLTDVDHSSVSPKFQKSESDLDRRFYDFQDDQPTIEGSADLLEYERSQHDNLDGENPGVTLVSVDGHKFTVPILESEPTEENLQLNIPQIHLVPGEGTDFDEGNEEFGSGENVCAADYVSGKDDSTADVPSSIYSSNIDNCTSEVQPEDCQRKEGPICHTEETDTEEATSCIKTENVFKSCLDFHELAQQQDENDNLQDKTTSSLVDQNSAKEPNENCSNVDENEQENIKQSRHIDELSSLSGATSSHDSNSPKLKVELQGVDKDASVEVDTGSGSHSGTNDVEGNDNQQTIVLENTSEEDIVTAPQTITSNEEDQRHFGLRFDISLCGHKLKAGMGFIAAAEVFEAHRISAEEFRVSAPSITKNENLIVKFRESYLPWEKAAPLVLGMVAFDLDLPVGPEDTIPVGQDDTLKSSVDDPGPSSSGHRWRFWPLAFRKVKTAEHTSSDESSEDIFVDSASDFFGSVGEPSPTSGSRESPRKQFVRTNVPSSEMIASLNLKDGQNMVTFSYSTRVLGKQKVDAHVYLWKWNARIVISDVDGTITKSDVLGQVMPLVGKDWNQTGVTRLFSAIKENGYQLLFLSARAIVQAYLTRKFLVNLKQDGKNLPKGPMVISPDGLFPSLYREIIKRAPHEFKIACLEDIKRLFPSDYNPFYAGFGNRDTDELSYSKIGIPKGKIFIINPKGEVAINDRKIDAKSYTSLHTLVNDMFPPTSLLEQEDFNSWNFWRVPLPDID
ncbi:phosphatidate phosphatase LPIN10 [Trifolium pratense]|uniref:phosphatidate phosphatase n=1 Tax=Trifolium pratense TaxID=57577 RepID=A0A2K3P6K0_TRIPR|nr:phosphatidate phosphatase LPIN8 [Trifolium pratense]PNY12939.1 phosphatidate phosphatase LPIN9 [Trifolium pratense]PNY16564.1 phosphatidate phosphatase LPIN10 [Trifolium pratense]